MPEHTRCIIIDGWNAALKFVDRFSKQLGVRIDMILPRETFEYYLKQMADQNGEIFFCVINDGNRSESSQCYHEENLLFHFQPKELIADGTIVAAAAMMTGEFPEIPVIVVTQDGPLKYRLQQLGVTIRWPVA